MYRQINEYPISIDESIVLDVVGNPVNVIQVDNTPRILCHEIAGSSKRKTIEVICAESMECVDFLYLNYIGSVVLFNKQIYHVFYKILYAENES